MIFGKLLGTENHSVTAEPHFNLTKTSFISAHAEYNVDYWGADIKSVKSTGLRDCYNKCRAQKGCVSFTMRKKDKNCWLKRRKTGQNRKTNQPTLISASLTPQSPSSLGACEGNFHFICYLRNDAFSFLMIVLLFTFQNFS